eukprot:4104025-Amphidinium_carterae.1
MACRAGTAEGNGLEDFAGAVQQQQMLAIYPPEPHACVWACMLVIDLLLQKRASQLEAFM